MSDEKEIKPAGMVVEEGTGKSNSGSNMPESGEYRSSNHNIKMEVDVDGKDAVSMEVLVEVKAEMVDGGELKAEMVNGGELKAEMEDGGELKAEMVNGGELKAEMVDGEELKAEMVDCGELKAEMVDCGELKAEMVDCGELEPEMVNGGELKAEMVDGGELKAEMVDGGDLKGLSGAGEEVLEDEECKSGVMGVEKKVIGCKRRVGVGWCKNSVDNGEKLCLKHRRSENKKNKTESNKKSKVKYEEVEQSMNVKEEEKDEGESSKREEKVLEKRERKQKATWKVSDESELDIGGERVASGGRRQKKLNVDEEVNYGVNEACAGNTGSRRRKDRDVDFEKVSEFCRKSVHLDSFYGLDLPSYLVLFLWNM